MTTSISPTTVTSVLPERRDAASLRLQKAAEALEATFVATMLNAAGTFEARQAFGGGAGEEAFADFRARLVAEDIASRSSLGIAEAVLKSIEARPER
jgi:peptidoglycan hydrolase FlgJ